MTATPALMISSLPTAAPDVVFKALPDGAVLFSSDSEVYFGLNAVGARVWELLPPARETVAEVVSELAAQYPDVDRSVIEADVAELLGDLQRQGLVRARAGNDA